jgi:tetratricopeptide (TPR) repeat protein
MEENRSPFQEEGLLGAARCYEALNQKQKALEVYQKALTRNPNSRMAEFIQRKVSELKG